MNKLIFQIGLLAFFITSIAFGLQGFSLFDTISRAFIVFIGVELIGTILLTALSWISFKPNEKVPSTETETPSVAGKKS